MTIPGITFNIIDGGLGFTQSLPNAPVILGTCASGTPNTIYIVTSPSNGLAQLGQGELTQEAGHILSVAGGPVICVPLTSSVARTSSAVTKSNAGAPTVSYTFDGYLRYEATLEITATGDGPAAMFRYSLDGEKTWAGDFFVPAGGSFTCESANLRFTFPVTPGSNYIDGYKYTFTTTPPHYGAGDVTAAITALLAQAQEYPFLDFAGLFSTASAAATFQSAVTTALTNHEAEYRFVRAFQDFGSLDTTTNAKTQIQTFESERLGCVYAKARVASAVPFPGYGVSIASFARPVAARAAKSLISTDLARVKDGALPGVLEVSYDERKNKEKLGETYRLITPTTILGRGTSAYVHDAYLKSSPTSDFKYWQYGRISDVVCTIMRNMSIDLLSDTVNVTSTGTISEVDAQAIENKFMSALKSELIDPKDAGGRPGHVSAITVTVNRSNVVVTDSKVYVTVRVQPKGYIKTIDNTFGFVANIAA